jgi:hypothetical protein
VSPTDLTERQFQAQVVGLAKFYGWREYHTHDSRRSQPGFPDLVLVRGEELIFAELKTEKGRVRPEQVEWMAVLEQVPGVDVFLWRPSDFDGLHGRLARGRTRVEPLYREQKEAA